MVTHADAPTALLRYGLPTALVAGATLAAVWLPDTSQLLIPAVALGCGAVLRPRHVWIIWIASTVAFAAAVIIWLLLGGTLPKATEPITPAGFLAGAWLYPPYLAVLALLPLWAGRWLRARFASPR